MKRRTKNKLFLGLLILIPLLGIAQSFETKINESYFIDKYDNLHYGVGHTYEYITVAEYDYSREDYFKTKGDWIKKTFSLYFDFFFDGKGNKHYYNYNSELSEDGNLVFDLKSGDKIILFNNTDLWYFTDYNSNTEKYESLWSFSKASKSRWLDE